MKLSKAIPAIAWAVAQGADATPVLGYPPLPNPSINGLSVRSIYTDSDSWQTSFSHPARAREYARNRRRPRNHSHHRHPPTHANAHPNHLGRPHSPFTNLNSNDVEIDIVPGGWTNPTADHGPKIPTAESHPIASPSSDGVGTEPPSHDGWRDATMSWYDGNVLENPACYNGAETPDGREAPDYQPTDSSLIAAVVRDYRYASCYDFIELARFPTASDADPSPPSPGPIASVVIQVVDVCGDGCWAGKNATWFDLSKGAFKRLYDEDTGLANIRWRAVGKEAIREEDRNRYPSWPSFE